MPMFHLLKVLIINVLRYENETWNKKTSQGKYYVRARKATRPHLGATRPRVGICLSRLDALTSKYNTFSYFLIAKLGYRTQLGNADARTRRPQVRIRPPSEDASPAHLYIYVWNKRIYYMYA